MHSRNVKDFTAWRKEARILLAHNIHPFQVHWNEVHEQGQLFVEQPLDEKKKLEQTVPPAFLDLAQIVSYHRAPQKWSLLYHALWRLTHDEKHLLRIHTDPLTHELMTMSKQVRRDAHKAKAFVRFRLVQEDGKDHYIAWHRSDHLIIPHIAPFFQRRFSVMLWTILTPDQSVHWDGNQLHYFDGVPETEAPLEDQLENLWRDYYRATFNPARIKVKMMKSEMPVRYWGTLPEARIIDDLLKEAPARVDKMIAENEGLFVTAADFLPQQKDYTHLRDASKGCQGCPLYRGTTQTVFGEGNLNAELMLVGEQPGDNEDLAGRPFVGPAGEILDQALRDADIAREQLYITNAVKHFKFSRVGETRYHRTPTLKEITGCKPWLEEEITLINPKRILALGNSAARSLINPGYTAKAHGSQWFDIPFRGDEQNKIPMLGTYHPSAILRAPNGEQRDLLYSTLVNDLKKTKL